jgi:hypothetical protein
MKRNAQSETVTNVKVADETWIAAALLQRENREQEDFSIEEIVARADRESMAGALRPGVYVHVVQHCVANRPPNPGRYRMLFETAEGRRRLFREGDYFDPAREGSKITPEADEIPAAYQPLLEWYDEWSHAKRGDESAPDPLLSLAGSGAAIWANESGDDYVRRLREGWE